jgi:UDP-N-acetylmuramate dehydrogenase
MKRTKEKISDLTTYRFGGECENVVTIESVEDVLHIEDEIRDNNYYIKGSNVAFSDKSFEKLLLIPQINNISIDSSTMEVSTGSGVFLPDLSRKLYNHSLTGGEFLLGIPGSVGGAIRMNAGCWGSEISNILQSITVYDFNNKTIKTIEKSQFKFGYRDGDFLKNYLILSGKFQFLKSNKDDIYKIMSELNTKRKSSQPSAIYNAGSVFKNPEKNSAGYLIESCGLKGFSIDKVRVSEKHANFFIAEKGAKAISLYELVQHVKNVVKEKHDILLEEEIKFVGNFE